jgi:hypothetical protein
MGRRAHLVGSMVRPALAPGQYRLRPDATLTVRNLEACLPYEAAFQASFSVFRDMRAKYGRPDLPFQVGIPSHLDLSVDAFGFPDGFDPRYYEPSLQATASQVRKISEAGGSDVLFQIETPAALVSVAGAAEGEAVQAARHTAMKVAELPANAPAGTRFGALALRGYPLDGVAHPDPVRPLRQSQPRLVDQAGG